MATTSTTTTMAMDAMIDSLKLTSLTLREITSAPSYSHGRASVQTMKSMIFAKSTICPTCRNVFEGSSDSAVDLNQSSSSSRAVRNILHHSLADLARSAIEGCHLCTLVYLGLDSDALKAFARSLSIDLSSASINERLDSQCGRCSKKTTAATIGFASIIPTSDDQANVTFRYVQADSTSTSEVASSTVSPISQISNLDLSSSRFYISDRFAQSGNYMLSPVSETSISSFEHNHTDMLSSIHADLHLITPQRALDINLRMIPPESTTTASDDALRTVQSWIQKCTSTHSDCNAPLSSTYRLPTYLLDVTLTDSNSNPGLKLIPTTSISTKIEYLTLTHAWGSEKPIRLHNGTLPALSQGIALSSLPRTLSDAATVTRALGYTYLWIDTLCTMHDSTSGVTELSRHDQIYSNAILNLSATCAWGNSEGFIRPRNTYALQPAMVDVHRGVDNGTYMAMTPDEWTDLVDHAPLHMSVYVVPERAFAKRTLHFTRNQLMWECQSMRCSEVYPSGIPEDCTTSQNHKTIQNKSAPISTIHKFNKVLHHKQTGNWGDLVSQYSATGSPDDPDKLLAFAGLARQYCDINAYTASDYIAGHWRPEVPHSLLWTVMQGSRPTTYRAPSWSWASTDGQITWPVLSSETTSCLEIVDFTSKTLDNDPYDRNVHARLRVSGVLARGLLQRRTSHHAAGPCKLQFPRARLRVEFDCVTFDEEIPTAREALDVFALPVEVGTEVVKGLLLVVGETKGSFRRFGTWTLGVGSGSAEGNAERFGVVMRGGLGIGAGVVEEKRRWNAQDANGDGDGEKLWFAGENRYVISLI